MIVITGGNAGQVAMALALARSLNRHGWNGKRFFATTALSDEDAELLAIHGGYEVFKIETRRIVPANACQPAGKIAKPLMILEAIERATVGAETPVGFLDPDVWVQAPSDLIRSMIKPGEILFGCDLLKPVDNRLTRSKWESAGYTLESLRRVHREVNTGVVFGTAGSMQRLVEVWRHAIMRDPRLLGRGAGLCWHDQDYMRAIIGNETPGMPVMRRLPVQIVWHMTPAAVRAARSSVRASNVFVGRRQRAPAFVHFAGGTWRLFGPIAAQYASSTRDQVAGFVLAPVRRALFRLRGASLVQRLVSKIGPLARTGT